MQYLPARPAGHAQAPGAAQLATGRARVAAAGAERVEDVQLNQGGPAAGPAGQAARRVGAAGEAAHRYLAMALMTLTAA